MKQVNLNNKTKAWTWQMGVLILLCGPAVGLITAVLRIYWEIVLRVWSAGDFVFSLF